MDIKENPFFPMEAGPVTLGIRFDNPASTDSFAGFFTEYRSDRAPDILLDFTVVTHTEMPLIPESLVQAKRTTPDSFAIGEDIFTGRYNPAAGKWDIRVKTILTKGLITRVFEQFLYQAFYTAADAASDGSFLLHSSGVTAMKQGFLFSGPSGSGKSTAAELSREYGILNDEINIITPVNSGYVLQRSPFNSYFKGKDGNTAPLRAIFLLAHSPECRLEPVSPARAAAELTGQIVPAIGLEDPFSPLSASVMMNTAVKLAASVPVYRLHFPEKGGFWPLILDTFPAAAADN